MKAISNLIREYSLKLNQYLSWKYHLSFLLVFLGASRDQLSAALEGACVAWSSWSRTG